MSFMARLTVVHRRIDRPEDAYRPGRKSGNEFHHTVQLDGQEIGFETPEGIVLGLEDDDDLSCFELDAEAERNLRKNRDLVRRFIEAYDWKMIHPDG